MAPSLQNGIDLADTLFELNCIEEAERVARHACVLDPKSIEANNQLALVLVGLDRYDEALEIARTTCARHPDEVSARTVLAVALSESGDQDAALKEAKAAVEAAPTDCRSHCALGSVYLKMEEGAGALAAFERATDCLSASGAQPMRATRSICAAGLAAALTLLTRHDEAVAAFDVLLRDDPILFERWPEVATFYERSVQHTNRSG
jgi:tetratricopeptide (TPR) repeat protein